MIYNLQKKLRTCVFVGLALLCGSGSLHAQPGVWESHGPELALSISAIHADPADPFRLYVGSRPTGIFFSANGGVTWQQTPPPLSVGRISTITTHGGRLFAGNSAGIGLIGPENATGLFVSDDGGVSWSEIADFEEVGISAMLSLGSRLIASTDRFAGVFASDDNGATWQQLSDLGAFPVYSFLEHRGRIYTGSDIKRVYVSADSGDTWQPSGLSGVGISVFAALDSTIVGGANRDCCGSSNGLYLSRDEGESFEKVAAVMNNRVYALTRIASTLFAGTEAGIFFSPDTGRTWIAGAGPVAAQTILTFRAAGDVVLAGSAEGGIFKSTDSGANWTAVDFPATDAPVSTILALDGSVYAGTEGAGVFVSSNAGDTWFPRQIRASQKADGLVLDPNFFLSWGEGIYRSVDAGTNWEPATPPLNALQVTNIARKGNTLYASTEDGLWLGVDGLNWARANAPINTGMINDILFVNDTAVVAGSGIFFSPDGQNWRSAGLPPVQVLGLFHHENAFFAGVSSAGVLRSTSPEGPWIRATGLISNKNVRRFFAFDGVLYAATQLNGLYRSEDGLTWNAIGGPLVEAAVNDMMLYKGQLFAATGSTRGGRRNSGLYASADSGRTWNQLELPGRRFDVLSLLEIDGFLYAGGSSAWVTADGADWNPIVLGLRTGRINKLAIYRFPDEIRLYAASENGVFLTTNDQREPTPIRIAPVSKSGFVSDLQLALNIDAEGADSVIVAEDSTFSNTPWLPFAQLVNYEMNPTNGLKTIYARFKDISWNLSPRIETTITLDTEPPAFAPHTVPMAVRPDSSVLIQQQAIDANLASVALFYRRPGEPFTENRRTFFENDSATIEGLFVSSRGLDYRIVATDAAGLSDTLKNGARNFFSLPIAINTSELGSSPGLPGGTGGAAFRMISVPMELEGSPAVQTVFGDLGPYGAEGDWLFWNYDGGGAWNQGEATALETGASYFLLLRNGRTLTNQISGQSMPTLAGVAGTIDAWHLRGDDWTLIGNPYNTRIDPRQLKFKRLNKRLVEADASVQVWAYDGRSENNGWTSDEIVLLPWGGLAVYSAQPDTIVFANPDDPFAPPGFLKSVSSAEEAEAADDDGWQLRVVARAGSATDAANYFGVRHGAAAGLDEHDWHEPPRLPGSVSLSSELTSLSRVHHLAADMRAPGDGSYEWRLQVRANGGERVVLDFSQLHTVPAEFDILLLDESTGLLTDTRKQTEFAVRISSDGSPKRLRLLAGTPGAVRALTAGLALLPTEFALHQNYPNPFNPTTVVRFALPERADVTLTVFDATGRVAARLLDRADRVAGTHEVVADLSRQASGVYFYRLEVRGERRLRFQRKMLLIK